MLEEWICLGFNCGHMSKKRAVDEGVEGEREVEGADEILMQKHYHLLPHSL